MYRLSLIVTAVGLLLAGSASAGPRANPRTGTGAPATVCKDEPGAIRAFANSRLTSRARRLLRVPFPIVG